MDARPTEGPQLERRQGRQPLRRLLAFQLVATAATVAVVVVVVPVADAARVLWRLDPGWGAIACAWMILDRLSFVLRWHLLLAPLGIRQSFGYSLAVSLIGYFYGIVAPATLGPDVCRVSLVARRHGLQPAHLAATVLADRMVGLFAVVVLGFTLLAVGHQAPLSTPLWVLTACGVLAIVAFRAVAARSAPTAPPPPGAVGRWTHAIREGAAQAAGQVLSYRGHLPRLAFALVVSCAGTTAGGLGLYSWARAVGADLAPSAGVAANVLLTVISAVPLAVAGLGVSEGVLVLVMGSAGVPPAYSLAVGLAGRIVRTAMNLLGGVVQFWGTRRPAVTAGDEALASTARAQDGGR